MKTTAYYLDALRVHYGVKSDYALSPLIGIAPPHISRFRKLQGTFSEEFCLKIADILDVDPAEIFLAMHHQREKNEAAKQVWERIYKSMTAVAAVLAVVAVLPFGLEILGIAWNAQHAGSSALFGFAAFTAPDSVYYVKSPELQAIAANWPAF